VLFDTAPTGHTLRLLSLPSAWTGFIETSSAGTSCVGPLQGLIEQAELYSAAVGTLSNGEQTTLVLVSRPERSAFDEAARTAEEFIELDIRNQELVINGMFEATDRTDGVAVALEARGTDALAGMPAVLAGLKRIEIPLRPKQVVGVGSLENFFDSSSGDVPQLDAGRVKVLSSGAHVSGWENFDGLINRLDCSEGVIMTMGKGGVGKTTVAASIARELAARGRNVVLTTTDPAAHVAEAVGDAPANLVVERIDPVAEVEKYRAEVMQTTGKNLDADGLALLEEDLSSPCTEEIAVFRAFAATVDRATDRIVVMDTAPTGHTILLLDAAQSFHKEVSRQAKSVPDSVLNLLTRLRDPEFTKILLCTLPEATPVHEAGQLQTDLRRAEIEPFAWVVNQSLATVPVTDPVLVSRKAQEERYLREVKDELARDLAVIAELRLSSAAQQEAIRLTA